jgi:hypothetical protein
MALYAEGEMVYVLGVDLKVVTDRNEKPRPFRVISCGNAAVKVDMDGVSIAVAISRIQPIGLTGGKEMKQGKTAVEEATATETKPETKPKFKPKPKKTPKVEIQKVSLKEFKKQGHEVFVRDFSDTFNSKRATGKAIKAQTICVIDKDHKSFRHFNLFDGTLGRSPIGAVVKRKNKKTGKTIENKKGFGTSFTLKDYDKKIAALRKGGYKAYTAKV